MSLETQQLSDLVARPHIAGEAIVKLDPTIDHATYLALAAAANVTSTEALDDTGFELWHLSGSFEMAYTAVGPDSAFQFFQPNYTFTPSDYSESAIQITSSSTGQGADGGGVSITRTPNDPYYSISYGLTKIDAPTAWNTTTGGAVKVAVIDSGVEYTHPDLAANIWTNPGEIAGNGIDDDHNGFIDDIHGWDFVNNDSDPMDDNGHGTHVAGTIAAVGNNSLGVAGVAWSAQIIAIKTQDASGSGSTATAIKAIGYAVKAGAKVVNASWGGTGDDPALSSAIRNADLLFVAAAGNDGTNNDTRPFYPASYTAANIISVAASNSSDGKASFSNYGLVSVDLAAPGVSIPSTYLNGQYAYMSGTSMAAPHVAGVAALLWALDPSLTVAQVKADILNAADPVQAFSGQVATGGRLNAAKAVSLVSAPVAIAHAPVIVSDGGGDTAVLSRPENATAVTTVAASDQDAGTTLTYSIVGGADAAKFAINGASGVLSFISAPDYEAPTDADHNNSYVVQVRASDGSLFDSQTITVNVTDVDDTPVVTPPSPPPSPPPAPPVQPPPLALHVAGSVDLGGFAASYRVVGTGDFNADGTADVLWRNPTSGATDEWLLANGQWSRSVSFGPYNAAWDMVGVGDFNHDGTSDVLWRNPSTGQMDLWMLKDGQWSASVPLGAYSTAYKVVGIGDFNGDGTSDVLWRNPTTGQTDEWMLANGQWSRSVTFGAYNPGWQMAGVGDMDGDGTSDVLWRNPTTGQLDLWILHDGQWAGSVPLGAYDPAFQVAAVKDLNGDGTADILWHNPTSGATNAWLMDDGHRAASVSFGSFDTAYHVVGVGDFDHNGTADILWRNDVTGQTREWLVAVG